jgi:outer membrane protein assembly factor BamB
MVTREERGGLERVDLRTSAGAKWLYWVLVAALILVFGALMAYQLLNRDRFESDPDPMNKLQRAPLPEIASKAAAGWPQWRGPNRDGVSAETSLLAEWSETGPEVLWQAKCGPGFSGVSIAGGRAYTMTQYRDDDGEKESVVCWDANSRGEARELWRFSYPCRFSSDQGSGPRSTPTIDGDHVYAVGATGKLHCLKADTQKKCGELVWEHDLLEEFYAPPLRWGVSFSPLVEGDLLITTPGGPDGNSVVAFRKSDGEVAWKALDEPASYSSPIALTAAGKRQLLVFAARALVSLAPDTGKEYWRYRWETNSDCNIATPIAVGNYVFISSGYGKGCALLEVVAGDGGLPSVHRVYESNRMCNHFSSSVYYKEHLYGFSEGTLVCMEFRTGKIRWKESGFKKGSLLIADGHLVILGEYGKLALARATPDGYQEETAHDFRTSQRCWTAPSLADGKLYLRIPVKSDDGREEEQVLCMKVK